MPCAGPRNFASFADRPARSGRIGNKGYDRVNHIAQVRPNQTATYYAA